MFEVWPDNVEMLNLFMRIQTQWRSGVNGITGLDYAGVQAAIAMLALTLPKGWFDDLQAMETAALRIMAEGRENGA
jgi:hypothetical protein